MNRQNCFGVTLNIVVASCNISMTMLRTDERPKRNLLRKLKSTRQGKGVQSFYADTPLLEFFGLYWAAAAPRRCFSFVKLNFNSLTASMSFYIIHFVFVHIDKMEFLFWNFFVLDVVLFRIPWLNIHNPYIRILRDIIRYVYIYID